MCYSIQNSCISSPIFSNKAAAAFTGLASITGTVMSIIGLTTIGLAAPGVVGYSALLFISSGVLVFDVGVWINAIRDKENSLEPQPDEKERGGPDLESKKNSFTLGQEDRFGVKRFSMYRGKKLICSFNLGQDPDSWAYWVVQGSAFQGLQLKDRQVVIQRLYDLCPNAITHAQPENLLLVAATNGDLGVAVTLYDLAPQLIEYNSKTKSTLVHHAAECASVQAIETLSKMEEMYPTKGSSMICKINEGGDTPMHRAVSCGNAKVVKALHDIEVRRRMENLSILRKTRTGCTPMYLAVLGEGKIEVVEMLHELDPSLINERRDKYPLIHTAISTSRAGATLIETLLRLSPSLIREKNSNKETPLQFAQRTKALPAIIQLLQGLEQT